ncbi:MAG: hypothetical protein LBD25_02055, partial [Coriobacteriales bacterium]|nr:hypothetical protein [Coriobacteriales bacterium]
LVVRDGALEVGDEAGHLADLARVQADGRHGAAPLSCSPACALRVVIVSQGGGHYGVGLVMCGLGPLSRRELRWLAARDPGSRPG